MSDEQRMADLNSPRALVCQHRIAGEMGGTLLWMVCLADGFLLNCGEPAHGETRARMLAALINANNPETFNLMGTKR